MIKKVVAHVKNKRWLRIVLYLGFILLLANSILAYLANRYDEYNEFRSRNTAGGVTTTKTIDTKLATIKNINNFPANYILDTLLVSRNYNELLHILNSMDSSHLEDAETQFVNILTDSLYEKQRINYISFNADRLNEDVIWAEKLNNYAEIDANHERLFSAISMYWFNRVSENLHQLSKKNSDLRYRYPFKYLVSRCSQNDYKPDIKTSNTSKIVRYITENKWYYLWKRLSGSTTFFFKIIIGILFFVVIFGFYTSILFIRKRL